MKSPSEGAQSTLHTCLIDWENLESGSYYKDCHVEKETLNADWKDQADKLWKKSHDLVKDFE